MRGNDPSVADYRATSPEDGGRAGTLRIYRMALPPRDRPVARVGRAPMTIGRERSGPPERKSLAPRSATITVMIRAAFAAAKGLKRDFGEVENLQVSEKGPGDFVSH